MLQVKLIMISCVGLLLVLGIVKAATHFSSAEQRAKVVENKQQLSMTIIQVLPYEGFNINAVVTSRAKRRAKSGQLQKKLVNLTCNLLIKELSQRIFQLTLTFSMFLITKCILILSDFKEPRLKMCFLKFFGILRLKLNIF